MKQRLIKTKRKESWTSLRTELKQISEELNISINDFAEVNINSWKEIESRLWNTFSKNSDSSWLWENLKEPHYSIPINQYNFDWKHLIDENEKVWFLANEIVREKSKFWIYEARIHAIQKLFFESVLLNEVIIASKKYEWILIINHHDVLIGTGCMIDKLKQIGINNPSN